ncbi:DUF2877 domain-containing protein [Leptotrichia sp. OH3620_COT-345]|uniref:oxamate carbamoyltransferase subunit AllH family protein n=1 Tax=Leptotrichia sp. OH3620_COT-345 TaxID=2491048 RepID=UPI000F64D0C9|nr:DUF2877 domain-containing protein [Leptotrichia sp. OH3620_COT-345]RRD40096.1 DUF2877 domain-containing protein [Leptotrichia sp. OH3620_COT-345]
MAELYRKYKDDKETGSISKLVLLYLKKYNTGYIHSVFNHSLNIRFGENLIHISGENRGLVSFGCSISEKKVKELILNVDIDNIVMKKGESLLFYKRSGIEKLNLSGLKTINLEIKNIKKSEGILKKIFEYLKNIDFNQKTGIKTDKVIKYLQNGITTESQKYLTGRGKGLTPSGDDILLGYGLVSCIYVENVKLIYGDLTTDISRQYFDAFNRGYVNQTLFELFSGNIENSVSNITKIGHTSGYDILFGIFLGIKNLLEKWRK